MKPIKAERWLLLLLLASAPLSASESFLEERLLDPLDRFQKQASRIVRRFSSNLDSRLYRLLDQESITVEEDEFYFTDYFIDETAFDRTNRSYVRLVGGYEYDRLGRGSEILKLTGRIMLPKTENRVQIFIGDETKETGDLSTLDAEDERSGFGVRYYLKYFSKLLHPSLVLGLAGIDNPYVRVRVGHTFGGDAFRFKPSQTLRYSSDKEVEEWTDFLFTHRLPSEHLLHLLLRRSTDTMTEGMKYWAQISHFRPTFHHTGWKPYFGIYGRTETLSRPYDTGAVAKSGIYNYSAGVIWKTPFIRDYLFCQLHPAVEYHEQYRYKPNFLFRMTLEFFIGEQWGNRPPR